MKVKQVLKRQIKDIQGEPFRFYAPSDTIGQPPYLVDLEEHGGRGHCECSDQRCVKDKNRRNGESDFNKIQCKHIRRCLLRWARREIIRRVYEKHKQERK